MNTIVDKVNALDQTKQAIKQSLINKGIAVADSDTFRSYADKLNNMPAGGNVYINDDISNLSVYDRITSINITDKDTIYSEGIEGNNFLNGNYLKNLKQLNIDAPLHFNNMVYDKWFQRLISDTGQASGYININNWTVDILKTGLVQSVFRNVPQIRGNVDISKWNIPAYSIDKIFIGCPNITSIDLHGWNLLNFNSNAVLRIADVCNGLETLNLGGIRIKRGVVKDETPSSKLLTSCDNIKNIIWPDYGWDWNTHLAYYYKLTHESILDFFNKIEIVSGKSITINQYMDSTISKEEKAIAENKGWTFVVEQV